MTETITRTRGWQDTDNENRQHADCPVCGAVLKLERPSYWHRQATCLACGATGRVAWNTSGGHSAYLMVKGAEDDGRADFTVYHLSRPLVWQVAGWRPEVYKAPGVALPGYVLDEVHREWAKDQLRADLPPGSTVYTILHHVSSSGMSRRIGVRAIIDNQPHYLDGLVAVAIGEKVSDAGGIVVGGCGMDMGFHIAYSLSHALYPDGFTCLGKKCPSNDHSNDYNAFSRAYDEEHAPKGVAPWWLTDDRMIGSGDYELSDEDNARREAYRTAKRAAWEAGEADRYAPSRWHSDGGYALKHAWL